MRSLLLTVFFLPAVLFSQDVITKVYTFGSPQVRGETIHFAGGRPLMQGFAPDIPVQSVLLALPRGREAASYDVQYEGERVLDGSYYIKPHVPSIDFSSMPLRERLERSSAVYDNNAYFPDQAQAQWFRMQYKRGVPVCIASVYPVQYNPVTRKIRYFSRVTVTMKTKPQRNLVIYKCTPETKSIVGSMVHNPEAVSFLPEISKDRASYEYLIVTTNALKDGWADFVAFNARRCLRTKIETIENIKTIITSGRDDADKLRQYIIQEYKSSNIEYVMLGGDANPGTAVDIPDRIMRARFYDHHVAPEKYHDEKDCGAEIYFSCLDGDWKKDTNGVDQPYFGDPGTEDMLADVHATRFPVDNTQQLGYLIKKTVAYSENPVKDQVTNILLAGQYLWTNSGVDVYGDEHSEEYLGTCTNNSYTTYGYPTADWSVSRLYEKVSSWTVSTLRSRFISHKPAMFEHLGHGNVTMAFAETNSGVTTTNYTNNGTNANYFIVTTGACYPGSFNDNEECILELFLRLANGAVAVQGFDPSGLEDDDGTNGVGQRIRRFFHDAIFNPQKKIHHLGPAHINAKESNAEFVLDPSIEKPPYCGAIRFIVYGFNYFGDPALSLWTKTPQTLSPTTALNGKVFESDTKNPYTWVALVDKDNNIITTSLTGIDGKCKIDDAALTQYLTSNPGAVLKVRMKAHNYLPYEGAVGVTGISSTSADKLLFASTFNTLSNALHISYAMPRQGLATISLYDSRGALVKTLANGSQSAGKHDIIYNTDRLGSGVYFCKLIAGSAQNVYKVNITK